MKQTGLIRKYAYLKRPVYKWVINNDKGGSFSNSGEFTSFSLCADHLRANGGLNIKFRTVDVDADGKETVDAKKSNY